MEALAVVWAVKHFRPYIYGMPTTVITDHQALKSLLNTPQPSDKLARYGVPNQLLSDRGPNFLSNLIKEVCILMGIKKINTTAYHPQTDGLVEHFNRTLTGMLAKTVRDNGRDWDQHVPYVLFAYRTSPQTSTGESPFFCFMVGTLSCLRTML
jgi:transposase InsO family protein